MTAPGAGKVATVTFSSKFRAALDGVAITPIGSDAADLQPYIETPLADDKISIGVKKAMLSTSHTYNLSVVIIGS